MPWRWTSPLALAACGTHWRHGDPSPCQLEQDRGAQYDGGDGVDLEKYKRLALKEGVAACRWMGWSA